MSSDLGRVAWRSSFVALAVALLVTFAACDSDEDPSVTPSASPTSAAPSATPTATARPSSTVTPSPTIGATPEVPPSFIVFSEQIDAAVASGDLGFFRERADTTERICTDADVSRLERYAACARDGDVFDGLGLTYWRSDEGGYLLLDEVMEAFEVLAGTTVLGSRDAFGRPDPALYAIGIANRPDSTVGAVLTAIIDPAGVMGASEPVRASLVTFWTERDGEWRLTEVMHAFVLGEEFLTPDGVGGVQLRSWQRFERAAS